MSTGAKSWDVREVILVGIDQFWVTIKTYGSAHRISYEKMDFSRMLHDVLFKTSRNEFAVDLCRIVFSVCCGMQKSIEDERLVIIKRNKAYLD